MKKTDHSTPVPVAPERPWVSECAGIDTKQANILAIVGASGRLSAETLDAMSSREDKEIVVSYFRNAGKTGTYGIASRNLRRSACEPR